MKQFNLDDYNEPSRVFYKTWLQRYEMLGAKKSSRPGEDYVFYRTSDGVRVAVLTRSESKNDGTCFFGDLNHFIRTRWASIFGSRYEKECWFVDRRNYKRLEKAMNNILNI